MTSRSRAPLHSHLHPERQRPIRVGVCTDLEVAERAIKKLITAGFRPDEITLMAPEELRGQFENLREHRSRNTPWPAVVTGGSLGAVLGGGAAAIGVTVSGAAAFVIAGSALMAAAGGFVVGGFVGAMMKRGSQSDMVDFYEQALRSGRVLVTVEVDEERDDAPPIGTAEAVFEAGALATVPLPKP